MTTLTLPLPPRILHPNGRAWGWRYRAAMVKKARLEAGLIAKAAGPVLCERLTIQPTFYLLRKRDGDGLNSWLKAYLDGIQDAGWVKNDSAITLLPPIQVTGKARGRPRVELELT
jgi:hypothetical protein